MTSAGFAETLDNVASVGWRRTVESVAEHCHDPAWSAEILQAAKAHTLEMREAMRLEAIAFIRAQGVTVSDDFGAPVDPAVVFAVLN